MAKYDHLKGIAHNLGQGVTSLVNYSNYRPDIHYMDYVVAVCKKYNVTEVTFDFIQKTVKPEFFESKITSRCIETYLDSVNERLRDVGIPKDEIVGISLAIKLEFNDKKISNRLPDKKEARDYKEKGCIDVENISRRGAVHFGSLMEHTIWYRDERKNQLEYKVSTFEAISKITNIDGKEYAGSYKGFWRLFDDKSIYEDAFKIQNDNLAHQTQKQLLFPRILSKLKKLMNMA